MPLGMEVDLNPGHIVLDGDHAPPHGKGHSSPQIQLRVYGCRQGLSVTWYIVDKWLDGLRCHLVRLVGNPAPPTERGTAAPEYS